MITSAQNPRLKQLRMYAQNPARLHRSGLVWVEGPRWIQEALNAGWKLEEAYLSAERLHQKPMWRDLEELLLGKGALQVGDALLSSLCDTESPQGMLALFQRPAALNQRLTGPLLVGLWGVQDPGNVGTLIRTSFALGASGVALFGPCADPLGPKALRASAGAAFRLPLHEATAGERLRYMEDGYALWSLDGKGEHLLYDQRKAPGKLLLLLGGEAAGLSSEVLAASAATLRIPLVEAAESLNVAAAGAIALAHLAALRGMR